MEEINQIDRAILNYLQDSISEDEMHQLTGWIADCDENKKLFFELKNIYELRKGGLYPDKDEIMHSLRRLNKKMNTVTSLDAKKRFIGLFKYAAVAIIFIFLTLGIQMFFHKDVPVSYIELDVESGPRMSRLTLPDGTKVVLNASTRFKYPDRFDGKIREVFLDGEAFFNVTQDEKIPFVVRTDKQSISVLGTTFNVMDYSADDYAVTTLVSGSVKVQSQFEKGKTGKELILTPNQQVFINKTSSELTLSNIIIDISRTWVNKIYHFNDEPLSRIMQRLEKIYGVKIIIGDKAMQNEKYTGTFQTDKDIEDILNIICKYNKKVTYTIKDEIITMSLKQLKK